SREKFVSLKKNTPEDIVAELEEIAVKNLQVQELCMCT
ncbi:hypothetical protein A2U01_0030008, partial [Trifolium medium]|nr:hypothetical protein [Trifolium medium]